MKKNRLLSKEFNDFRLQSSSMQIRLYLLSFGVFFIMTSLYDYMNQLEYLEFTISTRLAIGFSLFFVAIFIHTDFIVKRYQLFISIIYVSCSLSLVLFMMLNQQGYHYYAILGVVSIFFILLTELNRLYLIVISMLNLIIFHVVSVIYLIQENNFVNEIAVFYTVITILLLVSSTRNEARYLKYFIEQQKLDKTTLKLENDIEKAMEEVITTQRITVESLASLAETKDKTTSEHLERVGYLCRSIAELLPVSYYYEEKYTKDDYVKHIELASILHDVGKIGVTPSILTKPGPLTSEERKEMEQHTIIGYETLIRIHEKFPNNQLIDMGIEIARHHHENWDGSGYPDKIAKYDIPLSARIVSIVDVFDALISERSYKPSFSFDETISIMKNLESKKFDPKLLNIFFEVIHRKSVQRKIKI